MVSFKRASIDATYDSRVNNYIDGLRRSYNDEKTVQLILFYFRNDVRVKIPCSTVIKMTLNRSNQNMKMFEAKVLIARYCRKLLDLGRYKY